MSHGRAIATSFPLDQSPMFHAVTAPNLRLKLCPSQRRRGLVVAVYGQCGGWATCLKTRSHWKSSSHIKGENIYGSASRQVISGLIRLKFWAISLRNTGSRSSRSAHPSIYGTGKCSQKASSYLGSKFHDTSMLRFAGIHGHHLDFGSPSSHPATEWHKSLYIYAC
jgi:hypothetical protein